MSELQPDEALKTTETSDSVLVQLFRAGDESAAALLHDRYVERLRKFARSQCSPSLAVRFDPEDVTQSVFLAFFTEVRAAPAEPDLTDGQLWNLLATFTLNKIRNLADHHTAAKRSIHRTGRVPDLSDHPSGPADSAILWVLLEDEIADLPTADQAVIRLRIEGHTVQEIADHTGRSPRTVERVIQAFRTRVSPPTDGKP